MFPGWATIPLISIFVCAELLAGNWPAAWWAASCVFLLLERKKMLQTFVKAADDFLAYKAAVEEYYEPTFQEVASSVLPKRKARLKHLRSVPRPEL